MTNRRNMILMGASALSLAALSALPANAIGGNDPISGIDIIIKKDPGSRPIKPLSLSGGQLKKLNGLKGKDGAMYLAEVIAKHLAGQECCGKVNMEDVMASPLVKEWCGPCKMVDEISFKFKAQDAIFAVTLKIKK
ncbi:hypothetical protein [Aliiroseovarius lamellibrachiae]|uniref:hypothetical protein n=1 Tax=Aliiroseovarius lamellibrachiae TaxID=1924933 RepID=UPI001BE0327C|nr:hypothetical protein [Aliiroseovarius lamellibrachiae]MBT2131381.1 hypothetical protein [Aliiroseovarius lamellibrachiae]